MKINLDMGLKSVSGRALGKHPLVFWPPKNKREIPPPASVTKHLLGICEQNKKCPS